MTRFATIISLIKEGTVASSRRRFLTTLSAATAGGAASLGGRTSAWSGPPARTLSAPDSFSPTELLEKHASETVAAGNASSETQSDPQMPTPDEVESWYTDRRNWGRWGADDQKGAINLITPEKSAAAAGLVRTGRKVSMSRVFEPEQHFMRKNPRPGGASSVVDYYGFIYHGQTITHIDALCHMWDTDGMWQGRDPDVEVTTRGATFGTIDAWAEGIITRGVLIDVPRHRGASYVTPDSPVHGWEIDEIARAQGVDVEPGDALLVYSGKDAFVRAGGSYAGGDRPGLSVTCEPGDALRQVHSGSRRVAPRLGHDGRAARSVWVDLSGPWRALQLRRRAPRQRLTRANR